MKTKAEKAKAWREKQKLKGFCVGCRKGKPFKDRVLCKACLKSRRDFLLHCRTTNRCVHCGGPVDIHQTCRTCSTKYRLRVLLREGLSETEVAKADLALVNFNNRCQCCGDFIPLGDEKLDHDHIKKTFRGIICHGCNVAIGFLGDNPEKLELAAEYIRKS